MKLQRSLLLTIVFSAICHGRYNLHLRLAASSGCPNQDEGDSSDFPKDLFTPLQRRHGAILLHILATFYSFVVIAYVCNDYFLPSVERICQALELSRDVAGATFMAMATSFPEFFVNVLGTFLTETDLGVGTVVGSAVFNSLGVAACAGLAASKGIKLERWPLARDCGIYMCVVGLLLWIVWDGQVQWYEALVLVLLFLAYCFVLFFQNRITNLGRTILRLPLKRVGVTIEEVEAGGEEKEEEEPEEKGCLRKTWTLFVFPVRFALRWSVPPATRTLFPLTFLACVVWIGCASYLISWMMTVLGKTFGIGDTVMGLTLVAIGGSMPEATSSIINARQGIGSMSLSNALGGNTVDILLSLGLPWLVKTQLSSSSIRLTSRGLLLTTAAQLATGAALFCAAALNGFQLNRRLGIVSALLYLGFLAFILSVELGALNLPNEPAPACT